MRLNIFKKNKRIKRKEMTYNALWLLLIIYTSFLSLSSNAQDVIKDCPAMAIEAVTLSEASLAESFKDKPSIIQSLSEPLPKNAEKRIELRIQGPVIWAFDNEITKEFTCTQDGILLTATILHVETDALKISSWSPVLIVKGVQKRKAIQFHVKWFMKLADGTKLDHAPSGATLKYPIILEKLIK